MKKYFFISLIVFAGSILLGQSIELDHSTPLIKITNPDGTSGMELGLLKSGSTSIGNVISMKDPNDNVSLTLFGGGSSLASSVILNNVSAATTIGMYSNYQFSGKGRVVTDQLEIKAGSDLAEYFEIKSPEIQPGMIASIDPSHPGHLSISKDSYDQKIVGIVSGANGLATGMFMGQQGSIADGAHPIALTGRAYVRATSENGDIQPGDFLTTSSTPGHAMKVKKLRKAKGAILGKAMTTKDENGFVLVLINLQ